eukprot:CAMPEP_0182859764 /NCGR_PEP_ID=MMETSP0034_2-20130328/4505_1 /TAXON_ID=156128 /ORGANISM="Nephroselmis pyriformis, Strain CCMP717" /LENGTH=1012 /DNA_ID=CAMNT_0024991447 /DNA_START=249 /DNA_END=3283 /DNA_ORIENTATION=+
MGLAGRADPRPGTARASAAEEPGSTFGGGRGLDPDLAEFVRAVRNGGSLPEGLRAKLLAKGVEDPDELMAGWQEKIKAAGGEQNGGTRDLRRFLRRLLGPGGEDEEEFGLDDDQDKEEDASAAGALHEGVEAGEEGDAAAAEEEEKNSSSESGGDNDEVEETRERQEEEDSDAGPSTDAGTDGDDPDPEEPEQAKAETVVARQRERPPRPRRHPHLEITVEERLEGIKARIAGLSMTKMNKERRREDLPEVPLDSSPEELARAREELVEAAATRLAQDNGPGGRQANPISWLEEKRRKDDLVASMREAQQRLKELRRYPAESRRMSVEEIMDFRASHGMEAVEPEEGESADDYGARLRDETVIEAKAVVRQEKEKSMFPVWKLDRMEEAIRHRAEKHPEEKEQGGGDDDDDDESSFKRIQWDQKIKMRVDKESQGGRAGGSGKGETLEERRAARKEWKKKIKAEEREAREAKLLEREEFHKRYREEREEAARDDGGRAEIQRLREERREMVKAARVKYNEKYAEARANQPPTPAPDLNELRREEIRRIKEMRREKYNEKYNKHARPTPDPDSDELRRLHLRRRLQGQDQGQDQGIGAAAAEPRAAALRGRRLLRQDLEDMMGFYKEHDLEGRRKMDEDYQRKLEEETKEEKPQEKEEEKQGEVRIKEEEKQEKQGEVKIKEEEKKEEKGTLGDWGSPEDNQGERLEAVQMEGGGAKMVDVDHLRRVAHSGGGPSALRAMKLYRQTRAYAEEQANNPLPLMIDSVDSANALLGRVRHMDRDDLVKERARLNLPTLEELAESMAAGDDVIEAGDVPEDMVLAEARQGLGAALRMARVSEEQREDAKIVAAEAAKKKAKAEAEKDKVYKYPDYPGKPSAEEQEQGNIEMYDLEAEAARRDRLTRMGLSTMKHDRKRMAQMMEMQRVQMTGRLATSAARDAGAQLRASRVSHEPLDRKKHEDEDEDEAFGTRFELRRRARRSRRLLHDDGEHDEVEAEDPNTAGYFEGSDFSYDPT